jgi:predicted CopG family antitoxin
MIKPCVIVIEHKTREHLKEVAKKSQTYSDIINELIELKEKENSEIV